ncbi:MAG: hypothetical protein ACXWW2_04100, partial [Candidatus Deferrimicrobiaceae bacterium]
MDIYTGGGEGGGVAGFSAGPAGFCPFASSPAVAWVSTAGAWTAPGETVSGAAFDVARTVVRRAEREAVALANGGHPINQEIVRYLN